MLKVKLYFMGVAAIVAALVIVLIVSFAVMHILGETNVSCDILCVVMFIAFIAMHLFIEEYKDTKDEIDTKENWHG